MIPSSCCPPWHADQSSTAGDHTARRVHHTSGHISSRHRAFATREAAGYTLARGSSEDFGPRCSNVANADQFMLHLYAALAEKAPRLSPREPIRPPRSRPGAPAGKFAQTHARRLAGVQLRPPEADVTANVMPIIEAIRAFRSDEHCGGIAGALTARHGSSHRSRWGSGHISTLAES